MGYRYDVHLGNLLLLGHTLKLSYAVSSSATALLSLRFLPLLFLVPILPDEHTSLQPFSRAIARCAVSRP